MASRNWSSLTLRLTHRRLNMSSPTLQLHRTLASQMKLSPRLITPVPYSHMSTVLAVRLLSSGSGTLPPPRSQDPVNEVDFEENLREEERSREREKRIRRFKKIFSTVLFAGTLGLAYYGRSRRRDALAENLKDCVRLPHSSDFKSGNSDFFRCKSRTDEADDVGKPCVFTGQMIRDGTISAVANFPVHPGDVFVASFPKSGVTWIQEIVYLIQNDLDFKKASESVLENRFPFLEYPYPGIKSIEKENGPRLIKTHFPYNYLPKDISQAKVIYIVRNPKDVVVSYFHFCRMLKLLNYEGRFEDFVRQFERDELPYSPYFGHIESYLSHEDDPNLLILSYEDMSQNPAECIRKIATFLGKHLSNEEVSTLVDHTSFERMKTNPSVNYDHWDELGIRNSTEAQFYRKGKVGDWHNYFTDRTNVEFDEWLRRNNTKNFKFVYDL